MKIPYIKIYTADLLATTRKLNPEQIGRAIVGVCEQAFDNQTQYEPENEAEGAFYNMLLGWKNESISALKQKKLAGKNGAKKRWQVNKLSDGSTAISTANSTKVWQTETDTETDTEIYKKLTADKPQSILKPKPKKLNDLQRFSNAVIENFEPDVQTDTERAIWFKRNCRCLSDILNFCGKNIPLAIGTIDACVDRMEKAKIDGFGYEAVCRNLPLYREEAKKKLGGAYA